MEYLFVLPRPSLISVQRSHLTHSPTRNQSARFPRTRGLMQQQPSNREHVVNYYEVLGLPQPQLRRGGGSSIPISKDEAKAAYHRALLLYHPDKISKRIGADLQSGSKPQEGTARYSIDEIMRAYQTLAEPRLKSQYDTQLLEQDVQMNFSQKEVAQTGTHLGVESCDLEDLDYNEDKGMWSRSCRCGNEEGYMVTEADLESESKEGEIYVGCRGCSLFIKVLFGLLEE